MNYLVAPGTNEETMGLFTRNKIKRIESVVCEYMGETPEGLKVKSRKRNLVLCRHVSFFLLRRHTRLTLKQIARYYGLLDHSTVIHGINTLGDLMETQPMLKRQVAHMNVLVKGNLR